MNNIYKLIKEYSSQKDDKEKKLFLMALDHATRTSLKSFIAFQNDNKRFENMYDGWISTLEEEIVLLEVYSFVGEIVDYLNGFCVSKTIKKEFDEQQYAMIKLLLKNRQYHSVAQLLKVHMEDESFKEKKLVELRTVVEGYLKQRGMKLPEKFTDQLFKWVHARRFPPYMLVGYDERLQLVMHEERIDENTLAVKIAKAMQRTPRNTRKVISELIKHRDIVS